MRAGVAPRSPQTEEEDKRECNDDIVIDLRQRHIEACGVPVNVAWKLSCRTSYINPIPFPFIFLLLARSVATRSKKGEALAANPNRNQ